MKKIEGLFFWHQICVTENSSHGFDYRYCLVGRRKKRASLIVTSVNVGDVVINNNITTICGLDLFVPNSFKFVVFTLFIFIFISGKKLKILQNVFFIAFKT